MILIFVRLRLCVAGLHRQLRSRLEDLPAFRLGLQRLFDLERLGASELGTETSEPFGPGSIAMSCALFTCFDY